MAAAGGGPEALIWGTGSRGGRLGKGVGGGPETEGLGGGLRGRERGKQGLIWVGMRIFIRARAEAWRRIDPEGPPSRT